MKSKIYLPLLLILLTNFTANSQSFRWCHDNSGSAGACGFNEYREVTYKNFIYVAGPYCWTSMTFESTAFTGPGGMFLAKYTTTGTLVWVKHAAGPETGVFPKGMAVDAGGNIYITGYFYHSMVLGADTIITSSPYKNSFIAGYSADGVLLWGKGITGKNSAEANDLEINSNSELIVTGTFGDTVNFGATMLTKPGNTFLAKYSTSGNLLMVNKICTSGGMSADAVSVDELNNIYIAGEFYGTFSTGKGSLSSLGERDIAVIKLNNAGNVTWQKRYGDVNDDLFGAMKAFKNSFFIGGTYYFGTKFDATTLSGANHGDLYYVRCDSTGKVLWANKIPVGGPFESTVSDVYIDKGMGSYITGSSQGDITFGSINITSNGSGSEDYVAKYKPDGTVSYAFKGYGSYGMDVALDTANQLYFLSEKVTYSSQHYFNLCKYSNTVSGIESLDNNQPAFSLSPNPNNGSFTIQYEKTIRNGEVNVYDVLGKKAGSWTIKNEQIKTIQLDVSPGVYLVSFSYDEGWYTQKIVIQ